MDAKKLIALLAFALLSSRGYAQTTAPSSSATPAQKNESPTIVTNANEVTLDLVVRDKRNKPVVDLKPEDIAVSDSGAAVKVTVLLLVTGKPAGTPPIPLLFERLDPASEKNAPSTAAKILKKTPSNQL